MDVQLQKMIEMIMNDGKANKHEPKHFEKEEKRTVADELLPLDPDCDIQLSKEKLIENLNGYKNEVQNAMEFRSKRDPYLPQLPRSNYPTMNGMYMPSSSGLIGSIIPGTTFYYDNKGQMEAAGTFIGSTDNHGIRFVSPTAHHMLLDHGCVTLPVIIGDNYDPTGMYIPFNREAIKDGIRFIAENYEDFD